MSNTGDSKPLFTMSTGIAESTVEDAVLRDLLLPKLLTEDELAFYDALEVNDSAVKVLGEPTLTAIAHELVQTISNSVTIDWTEREAVRAKIRVAVKRILRKHGYPPDKQEKAAQTVLPQAELLCAEWAN